MFMHLQKYLLRIRHFFCTMVACEHMPEGVHIMDGTTQLALSGLVNIFLSILSIAFVWWILLGVRIEQLFKKNHTAQIRALMIVLSIILGHQLASFFIDYLSWSRLISQLIH
ncbi:putative integral membrane protein (TIGR02327 family) [Thermoactinomyces vulgaris]|nr:putative integral membrane protein (TIGR02327 family) [Thermoactinomyces vulgaris]